MALVFLVNSCEVKREQEREQVKETEQKASIPVPGFNKDSAYFFIEKQVSFGPRVPNTPSHINTGNYLVATLQRMGWDVTEQEFEATAYDDTNLRLKNIIASYNPAATKRILLAAHWDTRPMADKDKVDPLKPIDGANDGASGVGVLLEIARAISSNEGPSIGVDIIFFDGEDYGAPESFKGKSKDPVNGWCLGSRYWGDNKHRRGYSAYFGILLDMVGASNAEFYREGYSMEIAPSIVKKVWDKAHNIGHGPIFLYRTGSPITDDHLFVYEKAKIPMIDIIDYDPIDVFKHYHHTHDDNMEIIDKNTLQAVGETVLHVVYGE
ncbi:MAG: M28 family peptidase [Bacteroidota bacterium]|nr:M28 family peptidase [Bacteroidota bacterium]